MPETVHRPNEVVEICARDDNGDSNSGNSSANDGRHSSLSSSLIGNDDSFIDSVGPGTVDGSLRYRELPSKSSPEPHRPCGLRRHSISVKLEKTPQDGRYLLTADETELREILRQSIEREEAEDKSKKRFKPKDLVFTRQYTAFDRQNPQSASSQFHGFFTLFWLGVGLMSLRLAANNWRAHGSLWGRNEILHLMFHKDVLVLAITDGVLCGSTMFCLLLQRAIKHGYLQWNTSGWIVQNIWQTSYLGATIWWTYHRDWPWTHTVFIVLHCLTMLMKQHSYAFYNGHLSEIYRRRSILQRKLVQLEGQDGRSHSQVLVASCFDAQDLDDLQNHRSSLPGINKEQSVEISNDMEVVSKAMETETLLDMSQIDSFRRLMEWENQSLTEELSGKCLVTDNQYPDNLTVADFLGFIPLPTLIYELEYPRLEKINWTYVVEKIGATFGVMFVMIAISQAWIYPVVMNTLQMKRDGLTLQQRLREFPWVLGELMFPFMLEYLLSFYVIWECILNALAELTRFADRRFYADWWNSVSWDQFARDWNRPVHNFLLRHVYHSSRSAFHLSRPSATLVTFFLSACAHELIMLCIFRRLRGYLLVLQMFQLPMVLLSRTRLLRGRRTLGNVIFWLGIFTGPSLLCSLYLII